MPRYRNGYKKANLDIHNPEIWYHIPLWGAVYVVSAEAKASGIVDGFSCRTKNTSRRHESADNEDQTQTRSQTRATSALDGSVRPEITYEDSHPWRETLLKPTHQTSTQSSILAAEPAWPDKGRWPEGRRAWSWRSRRRWSAPQAGACTATDRQTARWHRWTVWRWRRSGWRWEKHYAK